MEKNNLIKKGLVLAVILLFIGVAFAPSINANIGKASLDNELVEFTTEVCGLYGRKQTVKLTQEEAEEVEALFESIRERLNATETREEAVEIFNKAIVDLDKYGLLGGLSVEQTQKIFKVYNAVQRHIDTSVSSENENAFCMIAGRITDSLIFGPVTRLLPRLLEIIFYIYDYNEFLFAILFLIWFYLYFALDSAFMSGYPFFPLRVGSTITVGHYWEFWLEGGTIPSDGWIWTIGLKGIKIWIGEFIGGLDILDMSFVRIYLLFEGVRGFFGIQIQNLETDKTSFLGFARKVNIEYY